MLAINCLEAVTRIRRKIEDRQSQLFQDAEVLEVLDAALAPVYTELRLVGQNYELDRMDVASSAFTAVEDQVWEYELPEYVGDVQKLEGNPTLKPPVPILKASLNEKDVGRGLFFVNRLVWHYSQFSNVGKIQIRGNLSTVSTVRIWFVRRWAPLHLGTAATGAGSTTTLRLSSSPTGAIVKRDDLLIGLQFDITADSGNPSNVGHRARITDYDAATNVATFAPASPLATSLTTVYALVLPLPGEHNEYVLSEAAYELLDRLGDLTRKDGMEMRLHRLREKFESGLRERDTSEPRRLHSSRGIT